MRVFRSAAARFRVAANGNLGRLAVCGHAPSGEVEIRSRSRRPPADAWAVAAEAFRPIWFLLSPSWVAILRGFRSGAVCFWGCGPLQSWPFDRMRSRPLVGRRNSTSKSTVRRLQTGAAASVKIRLLSGHFRLPLGWFGYLVALPRPFCFGAARFWGCDSKQSRPFDRIGSRPLLGRRNLESKWTFPRLQIGRGRES